MNFKKFSSFSVKKTNNNFKSTYFVVDFFIKKRTLILFCGRAHTDKITMIEWKTNYNMCRFQRELVSKQRA